VAGFLRLWLVLAGIGRIPPPDMITVLLLPISYHFPACTLSPGYKTLVRFVEYLPIAIYLEERIDV